MKKILSLLLMAVFTIQASAYDFSVVTEGQFPMRLYYAINPDGKTATVVEGPGTYAGTEVIIPSTVTNEGKTYTVTTIGASAFVNADITTVIMPNTITDIQNNAFEDSSVGQVTFSKGLKRIGDSAFEGTRDLLIVELPEGLESIGMSAFSGNLDGMGNPHGARALNLPSTLQSIGEYAFSGSSLTSVKWPKNITAIPNGAFSDCRYLHDVELPKTLEAIGDWAFDYTALDTIALPSALKTIGERAFCRTNLRNIVLPNTLEELGLAAFYECSSLYSIAFSQGMAVIPDEVCKYCSQLTKVTIPSTIKSIGIEAFYGCQRLSSISIPEGVVELGYGIFKSAGIINISLPSTIHKIPELAFYECPIVDIEIPENVDSIMEHAFSSCTELKNITLPKRLKFIGQYAFSWCKKLQSLELGNYVEVVGYSAFNGTENLSNIHVHRTLPPRILPYYGHTGIFDEYCTATLYVPRGTTRSYEGADGWKDFLYIVEEDVDGTVNYQVQTSIHSGYGTILVNGQNNDESNYEIEYNKQAILTWIPSDGWMLQSLTINGEDVTESIVNNQYVIEAVIENQIVEVAFKQTPVILSIKSGNGGRVDVSVEKGKPFTFNVVAEEGWTINCVTFNGMDVTSDLTDGAYTTPALYDNATLNVSFENPSDGVKDYIYSQAKVYGYDGRIIVSGASAGETIQIYSEAGVCVANAIASESEWSASVEQGHVYIVKLPTKIVKVAL